MIQRKHEIQNAYVRVLLGLFAILCALMALLGTQAWRDAARRADEHSAERILRSFVRSAVRSEDAWGAVSVEEIDGVRTLTLTRVIDGEEYARRIYCFEGKLCERFTSARLAFEPEFGEVLCEAQSFEPELSGSLLTATIAGADGEARTVRIALRCADE